MYNFIAYQEKIFFQCAFVRLLQELIHGLNVVIDEGNPHDLSALLLAGLDPDLDQGGGAPQGQAPDAEVDGWDTLLLVSDQDPVNDPNLARLREESPEQVVIV